MAERAACSRHPRRPASEAVVTHYIANTEDWRTVIRGTQLLGELCPDCRLELIHWICTVVEDTDAEPAETAGPGDTVPVPGA